VPLVALAYSSFFSLLFLPVWAAGRVLAPDEAGRIFAPSYGSTLNAFSPYSLTGSPARFADPEMMSFYPVSLLSRGLGLGYSAFVIIALVIASASCFALARRLTASNLAAAVSGTVYGTSGLVISQVGNVPILHTACWLPLVLLGLIELEAVVSARWLAVTAGATGLLLLGGS